MDSPLTQHENTPEEGCHTDNKPQGLQPTLPDPQPSPKEEQSSPQPPLDMPSPLENEGASANSTSVYQYPPIWAPEFTAPELGSCDELHDYSAVPQEEDKEILTYDDDDFLRLLEGEFIFYQEKNLKRGSG